MSGFPWLSVLWVTPIVGAGAVMVLPAQARQLAKWVAVVSAVVALMLGVLLAVQFEPAGDGYQFVESHSWIPAFGAGYIVGVDGIAVTLVILTVAVVPVLILAGWNDGGDRGRSTHAYLALTLVLEGMVLAALIGGVDRLFTPVLGAVAVIQLIFSAFAGGPNARLSRFGRSLGRYLAQVASFETYASEELPFPFADWPAGD